MQGKQCKHGEMLKFLGLFATPLPRSDPSPIPIYIHRSYFQDGCFSNQHGSAEPSRGMVRRQGLQGCWTYLFGHPPQRRACRSLLPRPRPQSTFLYQPAGSRSIHSSFEQRRHKRTFSEDDRIQAQENVTKVEEEDAGEISEPEDPVMLQRDAKDWKVGYTPLVEFDP